MLVAEQDHYQWQKTPTLINFKHFCYSLGYNEILLIET